MSAQTSSLMPLSLREYTTSYFQGNRHTPHKSETALKVLMAIFGLTWGIPWTEAASGAAKIFQNADVRKAFEKIFAAGIIITVGADGLWIMLEASKGFGSRSAQEKRFLLGSTPCHRYTKLSVSAVLSLLTCIPSVYASITFNTGSARYLSILTFLGNYGQGLFGYGLLFDRWAQRKNIKDHGTPILHISKAKILKNVDCLIRGEQAFSANTLLEAVLSVAERDEATEKRTKGYSAQGVTQFLLTSFILFSVTGVDLFLTKKFLKADIDNNSALDISIAAFCEIPGFVTTTISTYATLGRLFDIAHGKTHDAEMKLASDMYPKMMFFLHLLTLILALTAPSAAAYITYSTFGDADVDTGVQFAATAAMVLARLIFSNFTLSYLTRDAALAFYDYTHNDDPTDSLILRRELIPFKQKIEKAEIRFFDVDGADLE